MQNFAPFIGRSETTADLLTADRLAGLAALLDYNSPPWQTGYAPPLGHWLCFQPRTRQSDMDNDGHAKRGDFLPPVSLPRRMWASGTLTFHTLLEIGVPIERVSTITEVSEKQGTTGALVFVTLRHEISVQTHVAITEMQNLVYREGIAAQSSPRRNSAQVFSPQFELADIVRTVIPDPVLLFRFSALTFNAHRIHYDRDYARDVEGYSGLVVQGPLLATLLMDHFLRHAPTRKVRKFTFRALRPLLDTAPFDLCLSWTKTGARLWILDSERRVTMQAELETEAG